MTHIDIVFDGPPHAITGRFVEVEDSAGNSIKLGEWVERPDGYWALRIPAPQAPTNEEREDMIAWLMRDHGDELSPLGRDYTDAEIADMLRRTAQTEPTDVHPEPRKDVVVFGSPRNSNRAPMYGGLDEDGI